MLKRLEDSINYNTVKLFIQELKLGGLSPGRGWYYTSRSVKIIRWFDTRNIQLKNVTKSARNASNRSLIRITKALQKLCMQEY